MALKAIGAILVSIAAFALAFRGVELHEIQGQLAKSDVGVLAAYAAWIFAVHLVRAIRWGLLVRPLAPVSGRSIFSAASVGIPASMFLPLRLGELVRPVMIARAGVPIAGAMASVVVERVADGLLNVGLFFALLAALPATAKVPDEIQGLAYLALAGFGGGCVFLLFALIARDLALSVVDKILSRVAPKLSDKVKGLLATFLDGLKPLASPGRFALFALLTAIYWGGSGWMTVILARSYGADVPWIAGPFSITVVVFAVMVPAGPGFAGTLEAGYRLGFAPFGVSAVSAAVIALAAHAIQLSAMAIIAGLGFLTAEASQKGARVPAPVDAGDRDR